MFNRRQLQSLIFHHKILHTRHPEYLYKRVQYRFQIYIPNTWFNCSFIIHRTGCHFFREVSLTIFTNHTMGFRQVFSEFSIGTFRQKCFEWVFNRQCGGIEYCRLPIVLSLYYTISICHQINNCIFFYLFFTLL